MKVCEQCGVEIDTKDGDNFCTTCDQAKANGRRVRRRLLRRYRDEAMRSLGLVKVRGELGGIYWE